jgi:hypothetical protein
VLFFFLVFLHCWGCCRIAFSLSHLCSWRKQAGFVRAFTSSWFSTSSNVQGSSNRLSRVLYFQSVSYGCLSMMINAHEQRQGEYCCHWQQLCSRTTIQEYIYMCVCVCVASFSTNVYYLGECSNILFRVLCFQSVSYCCWWWSIPMSNSKESIVVSSWT